jgi:hypothetical protein
MRVSGTIGTEMYDGLNPFKTICAFWIRGGKGTDRSIGCRYRRHQMSNITITTNNEFPDEWDTITERWVVVYDATGTKSFSNEKHALDFYQEAAEKGWNPNLYYEHSVLHHRKIK